MPLDKNDVRRVAFLARIRVDEDDLEPVAKDLNNIIGWVEQLSEVDTDGVAPMTGVAGMTMKQREDVVTDGGDPDKVLRNAPDRVNDFFTVPKVVE